MNPSIKFRESKWTNDNASFCFKGELSFEEWKPATDLPDPTSQSQSQSPIPTPISTPTVERSKKFAEGKARRYIDDDILSDLQNIYPEKSVSEVLRLLLSKEKSAQAQTPQKARSPENGELVLLELSTIDKLKPFLMCPTHNCPLKAQIGQSQGVCTLDLVCPKKCPKVTWTSSALVPDREPREESKFRASNQFVFAAVAENLGFPSYERFCEILTLEPLNERTYYALAKKYLSVIPEMAYEHFGQIRDYLADINDRFLFLIFDVHSFSVH